MIKNKVDFDFEIKIDFEKSSSNPSRVFSAMSNLIKTFESIDTDLAKTIDISISPILILEDIEAGSLKSFFRNVLEDIDDTAIRNLDWKKSVGTYLLKAKYKILEFLEDRNEITNRKEIDLLQNDLLLLAEETNVRDMPGYSKIPTDRLLNGIKEISSATQYLKKEDKAKYITTDGTVTFNGEFQYDSEFIEGILTKEIINNQSEMVLKIKKPDYLGESMWDFKHGERSIQAKIIDYEWLKKFQNRTFDLRPGDSIKAIVEVQISYGFKNELIATHHYIVQVKDIITANSSNENGTLFT